MNNELKEIKKIYGEEMMHLCRELFPSILETEGKLLSILQDHLAPTHSFASDIKNNNLSAEFKAWIYSFIDVEEDEVIVSEKTPFELMEEAGYTLYKCNSEEDIQKFKKYYAEGEELCTFNGGRLNRCHVFFAVKKNVDEIKRENFDKPKREDLYGTSVISIQFAKGTANTLSIKNRYNHTVENPDATFSNDLDSIIPGLRSSFSKFYKYKIDNRKKNSESILLHNLPYIKANDGKLYRYNLEEDAIYFCENNILIMDGKVIDKFAREKERYLVINDIIVDLKEKKLIQYANEENVLLKTITDVGKIRNIEIVKNGNGKIVYLFFDADKKIEIEINRNNAIIGYDNPYVTKIPEYFLFTDVYLKRINLSNVIEIGNAFLEFNTSLEKIDLPKVEIIADDFLCYNENLVEFNAPNLKEVGEGFLYGNLRLKSVSFPKLKKIGTNFLSQNNVITSVSLPEVRIIEHNFMNSNKKISSINLPKIEKIGDRFLNCNDSLLYLYLPNVIEIGDDFLGYNETLEEFYAPELQSCGECFLDCCKSLKSIYIPKLQNVGDSFISMNASLTEIDAPSLIKANDYFLEYNDTIRKVNFPLLRSVGEGFLSCNEELEELSLPSLEDYGEDFLTSNQCIKRLYLPRLQFIDKSFLPYNDNLEEVELPELLAISADFLRWNSKLKRLIIPKVDSLCSILEKDEALEEIYAPSLDSREIDSLPERMKKIITRDGPVNKKI